MAKILGTNIAAPVVPFSTDDIYASHEAKWGKGGFRTVLNINERNGIAELRRENLMLVAVESDSISGTAGDGNGIEVYQLILNNPDNPLSDTNLMNNDNWVPVNFGGGGDWTFPAPLSSAFPGEKGERSFDNNFMYICIEDNLWKRMAMDFFVFDPSSTSGQDGTLGGYIPGSVPVWDGDKWDTKIVVCDVQFQSGTSGTSGSNGEGLLITYTNLQTQLIPIGAATGILGLPTDGGYGGTGSVQGQASGVNVGDTVEDAFDKVETLLEFLVPPKAPELSDWDAVLNGDVSGKLSFDTANPIGGYTPADGVGVSSPVSVDGLWSISGKRLGIHEDNTEQITGVLNPQVTADPNGAYPADTFGDADKGNLNMYVNDVLVDMLNLESSSSAISSSNIDVSAHIFSKFSNGNDFENFVNRTGTWSLSISDINITNGYNYVELVHDLGTELRQLDKFEFVIDADTTPTSFTGESLNTLSMSGSNKLSGVSYHTGGTASYDIVVENMYRNTYYAGSDAITHAGNSNSYGILLSASQEALANNSGNEAQDVNIVGKTATITSSGRRILNGSISLNTTARRTVQGNSNTTLSQPANTIDGLLLDNFVSSPSSTLISESFDDEDKRLTSNLNYDIVGDITTGVWDSEQSINDGSVGHTDGLQVIDGKLVYPGNVGSLPSDFRTSAIANADIFNDGGVGGTGRDYSTLSGDRTYYRYFRQVSPTTANFIINISGSGGTFVSKSTGLTGNNIHLEMKAPTETGWLDCYNDFATGQFGDGDGARSATDGAGRAFNTDWGLTIGTKSTANTSGYIVIKITVSDSFTGEFTGIDFTFN